MGGIIRLVVGIVVDRPPYIVGIVHTDRFFREINGQLVEVLVMYCAEQSNRPACNSWRKNFIEDEGVLGRIIRVVDLGSCFHR